jgi:putative DNA methylase
VSDNRKKLIEVALPLDAINNAAVTEKAVPRRGHPQTLHLWWARRPLAVCRAVLFASLVDDPSSRPDLFPSEVAQDEERKRLFEILARLADWENAGSRAVLDEARAEIARSCEGNLPTILDPFSGGASIPLEAQRLGLPALAADLNPVAVLIAKALIEIPGRFEGHEPIGPGAKSLLGDWRGSRGMAAD